jgi:hypothetical protein
MTRCVAIVIGAFVVAGCAMACRSPHREPPPAEAAPRQEEALFVYVKIPAPIMPIERGERFEDPLDAALRKAGLGEVTGGGSSLTEPDAQGRRGIEYCGIDVDLYDPDKGIPFLRQELVRLGVPPGTVLQYTIGDKEQEVAVYTTP